MSMVGIPVLVNMFVTLHGKRDFADVVKDLEMD